MTGDRPPTPPTSRTGPGEKTWILLAGLGLGGMVYLLFVLYERTWQPQDVTDTAVSEQVQPRVQTPELDHELLATVEDATHADRLILESEPFEHLLGVSLNLGAGVARALGMPDDPLPIDILRDEPETHRGHFLWYEGTLESLRGPRKGHPVEGYGIYEARIRTQDAHLVIFRFSMEPPPEVREGTWVRAQGFFLKLRDEVLPRKITRAPVLVGKKLRKDYEEWGPVTELDPTILARVADGTENENGRYVAGPGSELRLYRQQDTPLWHLAAYARSQHDKPLEEWREAPALMQEQWLDMMLGRAERGMPVRVLGMFRLGNWIRAEPNPAGIEYWTEVWVQVPELGGRLVLLWVAEKIPGEDWFSGRGVEARGHFFKRYTYETVRGTKKHTPVIVCAALDPYVAQGQPMMEFLVSLFGAGIAVLTLVFILMARRERKRTEAHELARIERRRRLRQRSTQPLHT